MAGICTRCGAYIEDGETTCRQCGGERKEELKLVPADEPRDPQGVMRASAIENTDEKMIPAEDGASVSGYIRVSENDLEATGLMPLSEVNQETGYIPADGPVKQTEPYGTSAAAGGQAGNAPYNHNYSDWQAESQASREQKNNQADYRRPTYNDYPDDDYADDYKERPEGNGIRKVFMGLLLVVLVAGGICYLRSEDRKNTTVTPPVQAESTAKPEASVKEPEPVAEQKQTPEPEPVKEQPQPAAAKVPEQPVTNKVNDKENLKRVVDKLEQNQEYLADTTRYLSEGGHTRRERLMEIGAVEKLSGQMRENAKNIRIDDSEVKQEVDTILAHQKSWVRFLREGVVGNDRSALDAGRRHGETAFSHLRRLTAKAYR